MGLRRLTRQIARCALNLTLRTCREPSGPSSYDPVNALTSFRPQLVSQELAKRLSSSQADIPAGLVDQILEFVRGRAGDEQNYEVLQTGLRTVSRSHPGQRTRLLLGLTELQADANQWGPAEKSARQALELQSEQPGLPDAQMEAGSQHVRACLAADNLAEASRHKDGISPGIERSLQGTLLLAAGLLPKDRNPLDLPEGLRDSGLHGENLQSATALVVFQDGLQCLAQGHAAEAVQSFRNAKSHLDQQESRDITRCLLPPLGTAELQAAILTGLAQAQLYLQDQAAAEDTLGQALTAAEGVTGAKHVRVAPVLLLLAGLYARTKRVTLAEGLYRNAAKLLQMDPLKAAPAEVRPLGSHDSLGALLAWRYCQLLTALPKREAEAAAWQQAAEALCHQEHGGWLCKDDPNVHWHGLGMHELFGSLQQMQGGKQPGRGFAVDLWTRRAYVKLAGGAASSDIM